MKRTISAMTGKGSVKHNSREFHAKNTDPERSHLNVEYRNDNIKDVYHELFDEALERYNEKQTRKDRKIEDYYEKIRSGKQEKLFHEVIFQIGDKDTMGSKTENGELAAKILDEYMKGFQQRNPTLRVFSAHLHMDEATPHLHIDFVPFTSGSKRGLDTRVSLKQALNKLGFKGGTRSETELNQWIASEKEQLAAIMQEHGIEWEQKGTHEKHLSVLDFEKKERSKEVAELEETIIKSKEELSVIKDQHTKVKHGLDQMNRTRAVVDNNTHIYDQDEKWQLPEPGVLISAKAYQEKKALPLVNKLKNAIKSLIITCVQLTDKIIKLEKKVERLEGKIKYMSAKETEQMLRIEKLQAKAEDLCRIESCLGKDQVKKLIDSQKTYRKTESVKAEKRTSEIEI